ncbi:MAG: PaaI family thioesterase [Pseudomonadota bacterium]|nr:PaaI family thioesterase [Pseudomonadota bacterium]
MTLRSLPDRSVGFHTEPRRSLTRLAVYMPLDHDIPFLHWMGASLLEWGPEVAVLSLEVEPRHLNRSGVVHGGIYAVLADAAGGLAGCHSDDPAHPRKAYTVSLTTNFLSAAAEGHITARGTLRRRGGRVYFSSIEITSDSGDLLALGEGSFLYRTHEGPRAEGDRAEVAAHHDE